MRNARKLGLVLLAGAAACWCARLDAAAATSPASVEPMSLAQAGRIQADAIKRAREFVHTLRLIATDLMADDRATARAATAMARSMEDWALVDDMESVLKAMREGTLGRAAELAERCAVRSGELAATCDGELNPVQASGGLAPLREHVRRLLDAHQEAGQSIKSVSDSSKRPPLGQMQAAMGQAAKSLSQAADLAPKCAEQAKRMSQSLTGTDKGKTLFRSQIVEPLEALGVSLPKTAAEAAGAAEVDDATRLRAVVERLSAAQVTAGSRLEAALLELTRAETAGQLGRTAASLADDGRRVHAALVALTSPASAPASDPGSMPASAPATVPAIAPASLPTSAPMPTGTSDHPRK